MQANKEIIMAYSFSYQYPLQANAVLQQPTPTIVFKINLTVAQEEVFGPLPASGNANFGGQVNVAMLNPMRYSKFQDQAIANIAQLANLRSTWIPDLDLNNKDNINGTQFTVQGADALYLRNTYGIGYATGDNAILTIVSQTN